MARKEWGSEGDRIRRVLGLMWDACIDIEIMNNEVIKDKPYWRLDWLSASENKYHEIFKSIVTRMMEAL
jgi:hypothetical protein